MTRLDQFVARRHEIAARYNAVLDGVPLILPWQHPDSYSACNLYVVRLQLKAHGEHRQREVFEALLDKGILVNLHYIPVHTQPCYQKMGFQPGNFPDSESYYAEATSLPMYPTLTDAQQDSVIAALRVALGQ